jgi:hypothetical protein
VLNGKRGIHRANLLLSLAENLALLFGYIFDFFDKEAEALGCDFCISTDHPAFSITFYGGSSEGAFK